MPSLYIKEGVVRVKGDEGGGPPSLYFLA